METEYWAIDRIQEEDEARKAREKHKKWEPDRDQISAAEKEIERQRRLIELEKKKIPSVDEWEEMSEMERRYWAQSATDEQLKELGDRCF